MELEKGKTNKEVAQLFGVPANTLSTWKKNKDKIFQAFQQGSATTKRLKIDTYDQVNKAVRKWFKRLGSENVPVNDVLIKEKALEGIRWLVGQMEEKVGFNFFISDSFTI